MSLGRREFVAAGVLLVAGCGFQPLHTYEGRNGGGVEAALSAVRIDVIEDRSGQILRNFLIDRLSPQGPARYVLAVEISEGVGGELLSPDSLETRNVYTMTAKFTLNALGGRELASGSEASRARYDVVDEVTAAYAELSAERAARRRTARALADQIARRISFVLARAENQ